VALAEWFSSFHKETLSFKILFAQLSVLLRGFCRKFCHPSHRNFSPPCCLCIASSWSTENDNYYWEPQPIGLPPLWGIHKRCILSWTARSNLLHSKVGHPPDRKESLQKFCHNMHRQNTRDGSFSPWLSGSSVISFLSKFRQRYLRWTSNTSFSFLFIIIYTFIFIIHIINFLDFCPHCLVVATGGNPNTKWRDSPCRP